ncbi:uncharacterized protein LOC124935054 [Impatiens glandulifera]|uniref:uncharacterized protein LOC124935054 n=1 Tax=Impatiens glandulifera TaxID=253017 RepID=UPI001FB091A5|nr:uncharacterized protein LOC124935054 [Impatiens glandulifera]
MSYNKAWRSRENALKAVRGTIKDFYGKLTSYLYMLEMNNPGTIIDIQTDEHSHFSCRVFDVSGLPCTHALAFVRTRKLDLYDFYSMYYSTQMWLNAYAETCYPVGDEEEWDIPDIIKQYVCLKPHVKVKKGWPTTNRRSSQGETRKV